MPEEASIRRVKDPQALLRHIQELLDRQAVVANLVERSPMQRHELVQSLVARQQSVELGRQIAQLHPADAALVLENLPLDRRLQLWALVEPARRGAVLLEVSDAVRDGLIEALGDTEILHAAQDLEADELAYLIPQLPEGLAPELLGARAAEDRAQVQQAMDFPEGTVGSLMRFDVLTAREDTSLDAVLRYLRRRGDLPGDTGVCMVVDRAMQLRGVLPLKALLVNPGATEAGEVMERDPLAFHTDDPLAGAAAAFERYGLISAPVVNAHGRLVGCLNVDEVLEYVKETSQRELLAQAGLPEDEDLYAPVIVSARNRWPWLALNLLLAFVASRVIGQFEGTIEKVVALAALMPIIANVGGNAGNQAMALMIRSLALNQLTQGRFRRMLSKEVMIGLLNGLVWGSVMALVTWLLYGDPILAGVMLAAMILTLLMAVATGVLVPYGLKSAGQDPALGSSILITGATDTLGFLIFLGLAALVFGG